MKNYVLYLILFMCCSCGSSKRASTSSYHDTSTQTKKEVATETIQQEKQYIETAKQETNTQIDEEIILVSYDPQSGNVQSVQTTRRRTGRSELGDSTRSGSDVSGIEKQSEAQTDHQQESQADEQVETKKDTRIVQGVEFLWIVIPIGIILAIVYLIRNGRKKHN